MCKGFPSIYIEGDLLNQRVCLSTSLSTILIGIKNWYPEWLYQFTLLPAVLSYHCSLSFSYSMLIFANEHKMVAHVPDRK